MEANTNSYKFRKAHRMSLATQAYEAIVEAIFDRQFPPGAHLRIDELARQFDMSATPVREALSHLAGQHLVTQESNRGFTIAPLLSEQEFHDLFGVRRLLEKYALENAKPDAEAIEQAVRIVELMPSMEHGSAYRDFREFNRADHELHRTLVAMSKNASLLRSWESLCFHLHVGRLYAGSGVIDFKDGVQEHLAIVEALQSGDQRRLIDVATQHIEQAELRLTQLLPNLGSKRW